MRSKKKRGSKLRKFGKGVEGEAAVEKRKGRKSTQSGRKTEITEKNNSCQVCKIHGKTKNP